MTEHKHGMGEPSMIKSINVSTQQIGENVNFKEGMKKVKIAHEGVKDSSQEASQ